MAPQWISSKSIQFTFARKWTPPFLISYTTVTLKLWLECRSRSSKLISACRDKWSLSPKEYFINKGSLKKISLYICLNWSQHIRFFFKTKSHQHSSLRENWNVEWTRHNKYQVHHNNKSQQYTKFHSNRTISLWNNWHRSLCFLTLLLSWIKAKVSLTSIM